MAMKFMKAKSRVRPVRKREAKNPLSQAVLDKLDEYLEGKVSEPMRWLVNFWADQAAVITYHELLNIVLFEDVPEKIFNDWFQDYSKLIGGRMTEAWEDAFRTGWETVSSFAGVDYNAYQSDQYVRSWILDRTGERITAMTNEQVQAVRFLIAEGKADGMSPTELARYIRPTIGLTERQAAANEKYYNAVKEKLREEHPRMSEESIEKKARAAAGKYAVKQQRYRAETIAQTELARAYNEGNDRAIRKMIADGVLPMQVKAWSTAANEKVCPACEALEGTVVGLDEEFSITVGKKVQHTITEKLPPIHPRCKCAIIYENAEYFGNNPVENLQDDDTMNQEGDESQVPEEYVGNFDDFSEITLDQQERSQLAKLRELSDESGFEYGAVFLDIGNSEPFTSESDRHVEVPAEYVDQPGLRIFHAHTNDTLLSGKDFEWLTRKNVEKIAVIAGNGDVFVSYVGDGYRPDISEYKEVLEEVMAEANMAVMDYPGFSGWSYEQRTYMAIREQAYLVARRFGWTLEGGRL